VGNFIEWIREKASDAEGAAGSGPA
jgi:hypothetical protein